MMLQPTRAPFDEPAAAVIFHTLQRQFADWHKRLITSLHNAWAEHGVIAKANGKTPLWPWIDDVIDDAIDEPSDATMRDVADAMAKAQVGAAGSTIKQLDVDDPDAMLLRINTKAVNFAASRAAEMIGRKYDSDGNLIDNPYADWAITSTTRDVLAREIRDSLATDRDVDRLADRITDTGIFSDERAEMIARTEINMAMNQGTLEAGRQAREAGLAVKKVWTLGDNPCPQCEDAAAEGDIDLEDDFGGDAGDAPPLHPNCECTLDLIAEAEGPEEKAANKRTSTMSTFPIYKVAKNIADTGVSWLTEQQLAEKIFEHAQRDRRSGETPEQAFARHFSGNDEQGLAFRKAVQIARVGTYHPFPR
jgi:hypothetical protein